MSLDGATFQNNFSDFKFDERYIALVSDTDGDGLDDTVDNCPRTANANQADHDMDGVGDACETAGCGNGIIEAGEDCDDGNTIDGDGCLATCKTNNNCNYPGIGSWSCSQNANCTGASATFCNGSPSLCVYNLCSCVNCPAQPACGNGIIEAGEDCDDGNTVSGDGCSSTCAIEDDGGSSSGSPCTFDADCPIGESCNNGNCEPDTSTGCDCSCAPKTWTVSVNNIINSEELPYCTELNGTYVLEQQNTPPCSWITEKKT